MQFVHLALNCYWEEKSGARSMARAGAAAALLVLLIPAACAAVVEHTFNVILDRCRPLPS